MLRWATACLALLLDAGRGGAASPCVGDCSGDVVVTVDEVLMGVNLALGTQPLSLCGAFDADGNGAVTVDELVQGVRAVLDGCPGAVPMDTVIPSATVTATPPPTATATETPAPTVTATARAEATEFVVVIDGPTVRLSWVSPDPASGYTQVRLLRSLNTPPSGPYDPTATVVFEGAGGAATDDLQRLLPDTEVVQRGYNYVLYGCTAAGNCSDIGTATMLAPTLIEALRGGGYVIFWRHAAATVCVDRIELGTAATTTVPGWWQRCDDECPPSGTATARQLDDLGVMQATTAGDAIRRQGIPFGRVLSSEFCRTVETAQLLDLGPPIEELPAITYFVYDEVNRCANSYALLAQPPLPTTNTALVGHTGFSCPVLDQLAWGEAAIFKPDGRGGADFVAQVTADAWATLPAHAVRW